MIPEEAVDYVRTKKGALDSACWFWDTNNINKWCDDMDVVGATKRINGGTIGLDDLKKHYPHAMDVLGGDFEEPEVDYNPTISKRFKRTPCSRSTRKIRHKSQQMEYLDLVQRKLSNTGRVPNGLVADGNLDQKHWESS